MITEYLCNITGFYHKCKIRTCFLLTYTELTHILTLMPILACFVSPASCSFMQLTIHWSRSRSHTLTVLYGLINIPEDDACW